MNIPAEIDQTPPPDPAASRRLFQAGVAALLATAVWFLWKSGGDVGPDTLIGLGILGLAAAPALAWARRRSGWFPAFEISCLSCIAFYALPLLGGHEELRHYPPEVITKSAFLVLLYLAAANLGFAWRSHAGRPASWATASLLPAHWHRYVPVALTLNTVHLAVEGFTSLIPNNLEGSLRALFFGIGTIATFVLARLQGAGALSARTRWFFAANLTLQMVLLFSHLYLIRGISLLALALIAYASARRRVPWLVIAAVLPVIAVLHAGKSTMRDLYWEGGRPAPTPAQLPAFFSEWIGHGLGGGEEESEKRASVFDRASLIHMLCLSVDRVPSLKPYIGGESYVDIPALFIPRFVWPDKPSSLLANVRLGLYFNLIDPDDPFKVSIAFGVIAEAYLNFGPAGVIVLGLLFGWLFKRLSLLSLGVPQFSALGILMILLTAWSFQVELVMATWISSLFQAAVVCIGLPLAYRKFTQS